MTQSRETSTPNVRHVRLIAKLADMLEYACWDYPNDASEAKTIVKEADEWLEAYKASKVEDE